MLKFVMVIFAFGIGVIAKMSRVKHRMIGTPSRVEQKQRELPNRFWLRLSIAVGFGLTAHLFGWEWVRLFTSEVVLRSVAALGLQASRLSFDTISINGVAFQFVVACTFVDVIVGSIPLLWSATKTSLRNLRTILSVAAALFAFNLLREDLSQLLYAHGVPWVISDDVLGGFSYFAVWLFLCQKYRKSFVPSETKHGRPAAAT